jgi:uncharacterized protein YeaO (DUF488 family)
MADFQPARRRGKDSAPPQAPIKFPTQHRQLVDMGFDSNEVQRILEQTRGDLEKATAILLGEESGQPVVVEESFQEKKSGRKANTAGAASLPSNNSKEVTEAHKKMMATYKVFKCKDTNNPNHDRKMCQYWHHSISDRRRNPFEFTYSCYECPNVVGGAECKDGDKCPHSHNMLERMFHPELFKISMCQRSQDGRKCDRGVICAFAHSEADLRISPSKLDPSLAEKPPAKPATADIVIPDEVKDRVFQLIKDAGSEGVHSSDLLKKYQQKFEQALEISDSNYATNLKLKEMLKSHANVSLVYPRGNQPVYVFVDPTTAKKESETVQDGGKSEQPTSAPSSTSNNSKGPLSMVVIRERLTEVIKNSGPEGLFGSDIPKKYLEMFDERLELTDETGAKLKIKEVLLSQPNIVVKNSKLQAKYCYDASATAEVPAAKPAAKISYSAIASAAAEKEKAKAAAPAAVTPAPSAKPVKQKEHKEKEPKGKDHKEKEVAPAPVAVPEPVVPAAPAKKSFAAVLAAKAQAAPAVTAPSHVESTENAPTSSTTPETESAATKESPVETSDSPLPVEELQPEEVPTPVEAPVAAAMEPVVPVQQPEPAAPQPVVVAAPPTILPPVAPEPSSMSKLVPSVSIADSPVSLPPSVFPVSESSLSAHGHDLLLFGIDKKPDSIELPPQTMQQSKFHDLIYNLKPSSTPFANTPLSPDRSRAEHSLMPPGLTKPPKNDVPSNLLSQSLVHDETSRKLAQSQSQISSLQDQINALKKELASSKSDYDNQTNQLKATQHKLKELEAKSSDTEPLKAQLKAKEEEFNTFYLQVQEELKRSLQERYTEMNQNMTWFQQIEFAIINSQCEEINRDTVSREDLLQFVHLLPTIRQFCVNCKQQLKYKQDLMQRPTTSFLDPYASANRGYPVAAPYQNMYDQSYFASAGQFAYGNAYSHAAAVPAAHQCALTGCPQTGVIPCSICYSAYYCCQEHQQ